tara:strand:- start:452 stop:685 length:234 start_codon:yes stop_codon:yes gene_type:complete
MNVWDRYPAKGTHGDAMRAKAKVHTFEYTCYRGRDRDDWSEGTIQALTWEEAKNKVENKLVKEGYTLKTSSLKVVRP